MQLKGFHIVVTQHSLIKEACWNFVNGFMVVWSFKEDWDLFPDSTSGVVLQTRLRHRNLGRYDTT